MSETLKTRLQDDMKSSMKGGHKQRLGVIRLMLSAIKQIEVDERIELDDARITTVLDKMAKQRRESGSPAPSNLVIPPHQYLANDLIVIGVDGGAA